MGLGPPRWVRLLCHHKLYRAISKAPWAAEARYSPSSQYEEGLMKHPFLTGLQMHMVTNVTVWRRLGGMSGNEVRGPVADAVLGL